MDDLNKDFFNFSIDDENLNQVNEEILNRYKKKNKDSFVIFDKNVKYEVEDNIIKIEYCGIDYTIEKDPYIFYKEEKLEENFLGKFYNNEQLTRLFYILIVAYDLYIDNKLISDITNIYNNNNRKIIIKKKKDNQYYEKFEDLNKKDKYEPNKKIKNYENKQELSPMPLKELNCIVNENFTLILDKRSELIQMIHGFMNNAYERQ